jgi:predicted lipoprotein
MNQITKLHLALGLMMGLVSSPTLAEPSDAQISATMLKTIKNVIRPAYADFHAQTLTMSNIINQICASPNTQTLIKAQDQFTNTALSWARIELFRSGPVMSDNQLERVLFYPDRKSTGLKQVQRILVEKDIQSIASNRFEQKSVAVQGLGALEFTLFGTGYKNLSTSEGAFRCRFANEISKNLAKIADDLSLMWRKDARYSNLWAKAGHTNSVFINNQEAINELLGTVVHGLETIKDIRLGAFLRNKPNTDRPKSALFWRSGNTLAVLKANLGFIQSLLNEGGLYALANQNSKIVEAIKFEIQQNKAAINAIDKPLFEALKDAELRSKLAYFQTSLKFTIGRIDNEFAKDLGLSSGFSFSDGD